MNKSLKEALGLLKPLKNHLEEAEDENKELSKEVKTLRRKLTSIEISGMGTVLATPNGGNQSNNSKSPKGADESNQSEEKIIREKEQLEETVRHLEQENSQLHDALDELSRMNNNGNASSGNANNGGGAIVSSKAENRLNQ